MKRILTNILTLGAAIGVSGLTAAAQSTGESSADFKTALNIIHSGGDGLPKKFDGSGVKIGIIDVGFDPNHITFTKTDDPSQNRVHFFQFSSSRFNLLTDISSFETDTRTDDHGTHVAGIAAGGYNGAGIFNDGTGVRDYDNLPLLGVAPNADIIMMGCGTNGLTASTINAAVSTLANTYKNTPMVINFSGGDIQGSHCGSGRDVTGGNTFFNSAQNGTIFCVAAGNEGAQQAAVNVGKKGAADERCVGMPFSGNSLSYHFYTTPRPKEGITTPTSNSQTQPVQIDFIVYDSATGEICYSKNLQELYLSGEYSRNGSIGGSSSQSVMESQGLYGVTVEPGFDTWFTPDSYIYVNTSACHNGASGPPTFNEYNDYAIKFYAVLKEGQSSRYKPGLYINCLPDENVFGYVLNNSFVSHNVGTATNPADAKSYPAWVNGTTDGSITGLSTIDNVISVGACSATSRVGYLNGSSYASTYAPGEIWPMSSYGKNTRTGERLPHVVAPGYNIVSAINRYCNAASNMIYCASAEKDGKTYYWKDYSGTSMATPFVAGTIALWLQANPELTVTDIKDVFKNTNIYPAEIEALPEDDERRLRWGGGMIQPLAGLKYILGIQSGITSVQDDSKVIIEQYGSEIKAFVAGETTLTARLYSLYGMTVATASATGDEVTLDTSSCQSGAYILEIQGSSTRQVRKIILR